MINFFCCFFSLNAKFKLQLERNLIKQRNYLARIEIRKENSDLSYYYYYFRKYYFILFCIHYIPKQYLRMNGNESVGGV